MFNIFKKTLLAYNLYQESFSFYTLVGNHISIEEIDVVTILQLLDELFEKPELDIFWAPLAPEVISKILVPCAVWRRSKV